MMGNNNYMGARDKQMKTQDYFMELENITATMTVRDILCTADFNLPGCGTDWYWVLQISVTADEADIELKYKSLLSLLEPIKDKFPGTEVALKLVKNAYLVLTDREKRREFDLQRAAIWDAYGSVELQEHLSPEIINSGRDAGSQSSGSRRISREFSDASKKELPPKKARDLAGYDPEIAVETQVNDEPIEKICNQEESCKPAYDKTKAEICLGSSSGSPGSAVKVIASKVPDLDFHDFGKNRKAEVFAAGQIWAAYDSESMPRNYALIDGIKDSPFQLYVTWLKPAPVDADERKWHEVGLPISCGYFKMDKCDMVMGARWVFSHLVTPVHGSTKAPIEIYPQKGEVWGIYSDWQPFDWCSDPVTMKGCKLQLVEILTEYSKKTGVRVAWLEKVAGLRSIFQRYKDKGSESSCQISPAKLFIFSHSIPAFRFTGGEMDSVSDGMLELDPSSVPEDAVVDIVAAKPPLITEGSSGDGSGFKHLTSKPNTIVLKPKWSHEDFTSGQIWAIYDGPDSLPRRYTIVNDVVSRSEVFVTYLEPHPMLEDEIHWVEKGLPTVSGLFKTGRSELNLGMSRFSHLMKCMGSTNAYFYRIYPQKGQIWATYKNWNIKWKLSHFSSCQYQVVEILSDFSDSTTIRIANLVGVKGHMTFFRRQLVNGFELVREVSKKELLSFSHQIPAFTVPEIENYGIPEGSWHLEPDALPPIFSN